jgi:hypothetical protein
MHNTKPELLHKFSHKPWRMRMRIKTFHSGHTCLAESQCEEESGWLCKGVSSTTIMTCTRLANRHVIWQRKSRRGVQKARMKLSGKGNKRPCANRTVLTTAFPNMWGSVNIAAPSGTWPNLA